MFTKSIFFRLTIVVCIGLVLSACGSNQPYDESMALPTAADIGTVSYTFDGKSNSVSMQATIGNELK